MMQTAKLNRYLATVGITGKLAERVKSIHDFYSKHLKIPVDDLFVSEYYLDDGSREYESLWFFSSGNVMEARQFIKDDDFDFAPVDKIVRYIKITKSEYDFVLANQNSRMTLHALFGWSDLNLDMKASKENCDNLRDIALKYILPNVAT